MKFIELGPFELVMWLFYIAVGAFIIYLYKSFFKDKDLDYVMPGYFMKIIGGLVFALIYVFYYRGQGDTIEYFHGSCQLADFFWDDPGFYWKLISSNCETAQKLLQQRHEFIRFSLSEEEWFMLKIVSPLSVMGLKSYLGVTYFMSFISFLGSYKMYQLMVDITEKKYKFAIFVINFLVPSVLFWGSGLLKDTITLSSFSFVVFFSYKILIKREPKPIYIVLIILFAFIIFNLKAYILICFLTWVLLTVYLGFMKGSTNPIIKFLVLPYLIVFIGGIGYFGIQFLLASSEDYKQDEIYKKIEGFQSYHTTLGGSSYSLGETEFTEVGLLKKFPAAVNVSLFRPYPWEAKTALVLINSLESMFLLLYTIMVFFRHKWSYFKNLRGNPFLIGAMFYCLIFSFFIGITSYNFGALSRFKIPIIAIVFFLNYYIYKIKSNKSLEADVEQ